jgi:hypothetical protein
MQVDKALSMCFAASHWNTAAIATGRFSKWLARKSCYVLPLAKAAARPYRPRPLSAS